MDETAMQPARRTVRLCSIGQRETEKGRLINAYIKLSSDGLDEIENDGGPMARRHAGRVALYAKAHEGIGVIYTYECDDEGGSIYPSTRRDRDTWGNRADLQAWSAESRTSRLSVESARLDKNMKDADAFMEAMEPLQRMYRKLGFAQRIPFACLVAHYLEMEPRKRRYHE